MTERLRRRKRIPAGDDFMVSHLDETRVFTPPRNQSNERPPINQESSFFSQKTQQPTHSCASSTATFTTAKWMILRCMGMVYAFAFAAAWYQNEGLMGTDGIQPVQPYMDRLHRQYNNDNWLGFQTHPMIFWWIPLSDQSMQMVSLVGLCVSLVVVLVVNSWFLQFVLWLLYFSIVTIASGAGSFYAYGWESQILETGFLCIFLCQLPSIERQHGFRLHLFETAMHPPTATVLWLFQWLMFRISLGAGFIKVRGSSCWTSKTCLYHHFETQPIPSPLSFVFHFLPPFLHRRMVDTDLVVQLYTSWWLLIPSLPSSSWCRNVLRLAGCLQIGFMLGILLSGNFSVLNHLTIVPALACWDDGFIRLLGGGCGKVTATRPDDAIPAKVPLSRRFIDAALLCLILVLSRPVMENLLFPQAGQQKMNASFDSFRLVNTYGAFGSVGEERYEAILAVSDDGQQWTELEFPCKPGRVDRRPCFCAPYHYRLDWNIWFLGFPPHRNMLQRREQWLFSLLRLILTKDGDGDVARERPWLRLLDTSTRDYLRDTYYRSGTAPQFAKVDMYRYEMAAPLWEIVCQQLWKTATPVAWWTREYKEVLIPPVTVSAFERQS